MKNEMGRILEKLTEYHNRREKKNRFEISEDDCGKELWANIQFQQIQKNKLFDLQEVFETYGNLICVLLQRSKLCSQFNENCFATVFLNGPDNALNVVKKANEFTSSKINDIQQMKIKDFVA